MHTHKKKKDGSQWRQFFKRTNDNGFHSSP